MATLLQFKPRPITIDPFERAMICTFCVHSGACPVFDRCVELDRGRPKRPTPDWTPGAHLRGLGRG